MRRTTIALLTLGLVAFAGTASAANIFTDSFSYPDGGLVAGSGGNWLNYSGAAVDVQVVSGKAVGGGPTNPANDDHRLFPAQLIDVTTYACFTATISDPGAAPKPIYFAELKDGGAANLVSRVYFLPQAGNAFTFGISHSSTSATVGVTPWTTPLAYGVPYNIVISYDPVNHSSTLWVNPANQASPSVTDVNPAIAALAVSGFGLRQSNAASTLPPSPPYVGSGDPVWTVDDVGVGTTFADACGGVTPTQSPTWGHIKTIYR
jgi:hypothetical protein